MRHETGKVIFSFLTINLRLHHYIFPFVFSLSFFYYIYKINAWISIFVTTIILYPSIFKITEQDQKGFTASFRKWNKKEKNKRGHFRPTFSSSKKCERQTPSYYHHNPVRFIWSFYFLFLSGQVQPDFQLILFLSQSSHQTRRDQLLLTTFLLLTLCTLLTSSKKWSLNWTQLWITSVLKNALKKKKKMNKIY